MGKFYVLAVTGMALVLVLAWGNGVFGATSFTQGKKRPPWTSPEAVQATAEEPAKKTSDFRGLRDPFKTPTEVLPGECPPSNPLCRFDRSQVKLVGVMRIGSGPLRGMVEDPEGRAHLVRAGMVIGAATVTQVTEDRIILHEHGTRLTTWIPMITEIGEGSKYRRRPRSD